MKPWLVLPVKSLDNGKSRLAPYLAPDARRALNTRLLARTLQQAIGFAGAERTLVVSHCEEVLARGGEMGALCLKEPAPGLNQALTHAANSLRGLEGERIIVLACDLPLVSREDLETLVIADGIALATDRAGTGTNALSLPAGAAFRFHYGIGSRRLHTDEAASRGLHCRIIDRPRLAFDLDTFDDWVEWQTALRPRTRQQSGALGRRPSHGEPSWAASGVPDMA